MDQYANCGTTVTNVCNLANHESQRSISNELQFSSKQVSKKISNDILEI